MAKEAKKVCCPNCLGEAIKEGNKIICEICDATFTFTKTNGAKVKEIGRLNAIEERLNRVENLLEPPEPKEEPIEDEPEEESILG